MSQSQFFSPVSLSDALELLNQYGKKAVIVNGGTDIVEKLQAIIELGSLPIRVVGTPAGNIGTAVPAADCNVALIALNADIILASKDHERVINAKDMFIDYCWTQLQSDELIKEIRLPIIST